MSGAGRHRGGPGRAARVLIPRSLAGLLGCSLLFAGCGPAEFTYVKNAEDQLYFKVPADWTQVDQHSLDEAELQSDPDSATAQVQSELEWSVAYDGHDEPSVSHVLGGHAPEPVVYAKVQELMPEQRDQVSFDQLRNYFLPVTEDVRAVLEQQGRGYPGFELLYDEVLTPGDGLRGIHEIYNYEVDGIVQTFDQTVLVNDDASKVYFFLVRCAASCYRERAEELSGIAQSMTVRG
jgi:hypothetical protein